MKQNHTAITPLLLMLMYIGLGFFSIQLGSLNEGNLAVVWLASGAGLILMLRLGRIAPYAVLLSSFAVNTPFYIAKDSLSVRVALLCGLTTAAVDTLQSYLAQRQYQQLLLTEKGDIWPASHRLPIHWLRIGLLPCALTMPALILLQHSIGLMQSGTPSEMIRSTLSLIMGDTAGILLMLPLYQCWLSRRLMHTLRRAWLPMLGVTVFTVIAIFFYKYLMVLSLPIMLYIAVRYLQPGVSIALFIMTQLCVVGTAMGYGQFANASSALAFFNLQLFIFAIMLTMQYHASTQASLQRRQGELEQQIQARTQELISANAQLLELASTDDLTQVPNRREWQKRCAEAIVRSRRYKQPMSIILLDIDHFKKINDRHGHLIGDLVLKRISQICVSKLRTIDTFARWGGEEFVILLPETDQQQATIVAEKLRKTIEAEPLNFEGSQAIRATISLGVTALSMIDLTLDDLITRTDEALYAAKANGRNCVINSDTMSTSYLSPGMNHSAQR
ncbi:diguanylate cyclase [Chitinibacter fontanus]|uniref:diguanylate cyclase n=1 Tax=Chitinibacter fontanus TaxID=1737446 RepID=A0A7D5V7K8_9NEIS|nr:diguanylate cyclase [Chitinibacter fontanus]QLI80231.1 diguanylate cyclase [Chitinibacter fontanus]